MGHILSAIGVTAAQFGISFSNVDDNYIFIEKIINNYLNIYLNKIQSNNTHKAITKAFYFSPMPCFGITSPFIFIYILLYDKLFPTFVNFFHSKIINFFIFVSFLFAR